MCVCVRLSVSLSQRTNVISCVTVHDSDSSNASPLTPLTPLGRGHLPSSVLSSRQHARSLAVVAPSVKAPASDRGAAPRPRTDTGEPQPDPQLVLFSGGSHVTRYY